MTQSTNQQFDLTKKGDLKTTKNNVDLLNLKIKELENRWDSLIWITPNSAVKGPAGKPSQAVRIWK